jgi:hypothetical protein
VQSHLLGLGEKYCEEDVPRDDAVVGVLKPHEESTFAGDEDSQLVIVPISQMRSSLIFA